MPVLCLSILLCLPIYAQAPAADQGKQVVLVQAIRVKGSRLADKSVLHLTGLQPGQHLDEAQLRTALQHATQSGLFKNISYTYESAPDSTAVILELNVEDQLPLVPATIRIAKVNPEDVWRYLETVDAFFTREMPTSVNAINLYARYMTKYLQSTGVQDLAVAGNVIGTPSPTGVEFVGLKLRSTGK